MIRYLAASLAARLRGARALTLLTVAGVALGVAAVVSIQWIQRSAVAAFEAGLTAVAGDFDLAVEGDAGRLPDRVLVETLRCPGVAAAWPRLEVSVRLRAAVGERRPFLTLYGVDVTLTEGAVLSREGEGLLGPLTTPGFVALPAALVAEAGLSLDDAVEVVAGSRSVALLLGAILDPERLPAALGPGFGVMDVAEMQRLFDLAGRVDRVDVRVAAGADREAVRAELARRLGDGVGVLSRDDASARAETLLEAFRLNLTALSLVSLAVGTFLVFASAQAALLRRRREFGVLRSLGATRGQVLRLILAEMTLVGVAGTALGLPLGRLAAQAQLEAVSGTLRFHYLIEGVVALAAPPWLPLLALLVGLGGSLLGALAPALDLARREPRALLSFQALEERVARASLPLLLCGLAIVAAAAAWYARFGAEFRPAGFVLGVALLAALPLFAPALIAAVGGRVVPRRFGLAWSLKSLGERVGTAAVPVAALGLAVTMLFGVTQLVLSFRGTVATWVDATMQADVYVAGEGRRRGGRDVPLEPEIVAAIGAFPGVAAVDRLREAYVRIGERRVPVVGVDAGLARGLHRYRLLDGRAGDGRDAARAALAALAAGDAALVGEPLARRLGLQAGDRVDLPVPGGARAFTVAGVHYDYATEAGSVILDLAAFERAFGPGTPVSLSLYVDRGTDPDAVLAALRERFAGASLVFTSNRRLREEALSIFDRTFAVTELLQAMALLIAACAVALALLSLARERAAELALYRALGATRRQVFGVFLGKGAAIGGLGLVIGAAGGGALAWILVHAVNRAYFGWTIRLELPLGALAIQAATVLAVVLLASLDPALRAGRTGARELAREDA